MYYIKTSAAFDSAHFLKGYNGKCANIHGHHWVVEVKLAGDSLTDEGTKRGMLIDFGDIKHELRALARSFDHALIYEEDSLMETTIKALSSENFRLIPVPFRPTAENFARHFYELLSDKKLPVKSVKVFETPENCAEYEGGEL